MLVTMVAVDDDGDGGDDDDHGGDDDDDGGDHVHHGGCHDGDGVFGHDNNGEVLKDCFRWSWVMGDWGALSAFLLSLWSGLVDMMTRSYQVVIFVFLLHDMLF